MRLFTNLVATSKLTIFEQLRGHFLFCLGYFKSDVIFKYEVLAQCQVKKCSTKNAQAIKARKTAKINGFFDKEVS